MLINNLDELISLTKLELNLRLYLIINYKIKEYNIYQKV